MISGTMQQNKVYAQYFALWPMLSCRKSPAIAKFCPIAFSLLIVSCLYIFHPVQMDRWAFLKWHWMVRMTLNSQTIQGMECHFMHSAIHFFSKMLYNRLRIFLWSEEDWVLHTDFLNNTVWNSLEWYLGIRDLWVNCYTIMYLQLDV
jgi:hypothetical protein